MIGVLESGNSDAVHRALRRVGHTTSTFASGVTYSAVVLPGVGHFAYCMDRLRDGRVDLEALKRRVDEGMPLLGICVGAQMLFGSSDEAPLGPAGLGWLDGHVRRVEGRAPRVGWFPVEGETYYFVHSYELPAPIVRQGSITAVQFHPEKSGGAGLRFLKAWAA